MSDLQLFKFENNDIRIIKDEHGEPWWVAKEISEILGYSDAEAMTRRLDDEEIQNLQIVGFGNRGVNIINESGLYAAIIGSQKEEAKRFKKWVTSEVLPSIRKTGGYKTSSIPTHSEALRGWADEMDKTKALEAKITSDAPKVAFADALSASDSTILIRDFVKILHQNGMDTGEKRFYEYLRN